MAFIVKNTMSFYIHDHRANSPDSLLTRRTYNTLSLSFGEKKPTAEKFFSEIILMVATLQNDDVEDNDDDHTLRRNDDLDLDKNDDL
jgi:hypothetical protein